MNNLTGDTNACKEQFAQPMGTLFEESMGRVIIAALEISGLVALENAPGRDVKE